MDLTQNEQLLLHSWGYYLDDHVPDGPAGVSVVQQLGPQHEYHTNALQRWQRFHEAALAPLIMGYYGRKLNADGDQGPAGRALMAMPRCGFPDILPATTSEEANWPDACRMNLTTSFPRGMTLPGLTAEQVYEGANRALLNVMEDFEIGIHIDQDAFPKTNINFKPAQLGGSVLADQYLPINSCDFTSNGRVDSDRRWEYWYWVTVRSHEDGHAYGLGHVGIPSALMYPSINTASVNRRGKMSETDIKEMIRNGYKRRATPPPTGGNTFQGRLIVGDQKWEFTADSGEIKPGTYVILAQG